MSNLLKNNSYLILLIILVTVLTFVFQTKTAQSKSIQQEFIITEVNNNEYFGASTTDTTGIYFTSEELKENETIEAGDLVVAYFENELDDSLIFIEKVK